MQRTINCVKYSNLVAALLGDKRLKIAPLRGIEPMTLICHMSPRFLEVTQFFKRFSASKVPTEFGIRHTVDFNVV